jgi:hypothetical protein
VGRPQRPAGGNREISWSCLVGVHYAFQMGGMPA